MTAPAAAGLARWVALARHADGRRLAIALVCRGIPSAEQFAAVALARARELGLPRRRPARRGAGLALLQRCGFTISAIRPGAAWDAD